MKTFMVVVRGGGRRPEREAARRERERQRTKDEGQTVKGL